MANIRFARVSTTDQDTALQLDALATAGCSKVFEDHASGAQANRVGLREALAYIRSDDVLVAWELDRNRSQLAAPDRDGSGAGWARGGVPLHHRGD